VTPTVCLLSVGFNAGVVNGSTRYLAELEEALRKVGARDVAVRRWGGWSLPGVGELANSALLGSWSLTGLPAVSSLYRSSRGQVTAHSVEDISVPRGGRFPLVVTVHDICALRRPDLVEERIVALKRLSWRRARTWDAIIVPSSATKGDVVSAGIPEERVHVIRHGLNDIFSRPLDAPGSWPVSAATGPFVLVVSPLSRKKGADVLLRAWSRASQMVDGTVIWVARETPQERRLREEYGRDIPPNRCCYLRHVSDVEIVALYQAASAVVVPSRWEGYSWPVAEAIAAGTPVIASDIPAHEEFGAAPVLFRSEDDSALVELLVRAFRGGLPAPSPDFQPWDEPAREHIRIYRELLGQ
jgi:glycosyltransferase involved in cell wall biosynthesis